MKKSKFIEEQIAFALRQAEAGARVNGSPRSRWASGAVSSPNAAH